MIAIGLSMDAFAVAIGKGLHMRRVRMRDAVSVGAWFGAFQFLMPLVGALLGLRFLRQIEAVDHWVAFAILAAVGGNMIREACLEEKHAVAPDVGAAAATARTAPERSEQTDLRPGTMLLLAVATSIDALAVGITFGLLHVRVLPAAGFIGCVTFAIAFGGVYAGRWFGARCKKGAAFIGGIVLILIGVKIFLEHLGIHV